MVYDNSSRSNVSVVDKLSNFMRANAKKHFHWHKGVLQESYSMVKLYWHDLKINTKQHFQGYEGVLQEAYSTIKLHFQDLRGRVVKAVKQGATRTEVAHMFDVSVSAVKWYLRQCREQSHGLLKLISGRSFKKLVPLPVGVHLDPRTKMERRATLRKI